MTDLRTLLRNYAELGRISNLPTCVSNALFGTAITGGLYPDWKVALTAALGISFLYTGGMAQNDLFDIEIDRRERPGRPLPSGRVSKTGARFIILFCFLVGLGIFAFQGIEPFSWALGLCCLIWSYNWLHKKHLWSVVLMGACRGLIYITAAACNRSLLKMEDPYVFLFAGLITLYTINITLIARMENSPEVGARRFLAWMMFLVLVPCLWKGAMPEAKLFALSALAVIVWNGRAIHALSKTPPQTVKAILTWISGFCLIDAYYLVLFGPLTFAAFAVGCFLLTLWGHRRILGT